MQVNKPAPTPPQNSQLSSNASLDRRHKIAMWARLLIFIVVLGTIFVAAAVVIWQYTTVQKNKNTIQSQIQKEDLQENATSTTGDTTTSVDSDQKIQINTKQTSKPNQIDDSIDE